MWGICSQVEAHLSYSGCIRAKLEGADCELPGVSSGDRMGPLLRPLLPLSCCLFIIKLYPDGTVGDRCDRQSLTQVKISQQHVHELGLDQLISLSSSSRVLFASLGHVHMQINRLKEYRGGDKNFVFFVNGIILYNLEIENIRNSNPSNMVIPIYMTRN